MQSFDTRSRALAYCLSALAGFVDAIGFIGSGGFFVSFMSGNSTRLGVGAATGSGHALVALGLIAAFVAGVTGGALLGRRASKRRQPAVLALVAALLAIASLPLGPAWLPLRFGLVAVAMGAENMVLAGDTEVRVGITYMTGTLVKIGQRLATALGGGDRWAWLPFLQLWASLIAGSVAGALLFGAIGMAALWIAAAAAAALALFAGWPASRV